MDTLIQDLLDVTRLESGKLRIALQPEALCTLMATTADLLAPLAAARGVTLETELEAGLPMVNIDPDRIAQVLSNLVGNAVKFTPEGGHVGSSTRARLNEGNAKGWGMTIRRTSENRAFARRPR